jgi:hypothetical protein
MSRANTEPPPSGEVRLDLLLGRRVLARDNRSVGRVEEFRAGERGPDLEITEYVIGAGGLFERLGVGLKLLVGGRGGGGYVARRDQLDISDPARPRLTCAIEELRPL